MNYSELDKLKHVQMEIMDEIHRLCVENGINYYIIGGTALGAVRHKGFIPWDVDIDIAMMRDDYEKFAVACSEKLSVDYIYRDYKNTKSFTHPHALVCKKHTFLSIRNGEVKNPKEENLGIYLDIFPLDVAPADKKKKCAQEKQIQRLKRLKELKRAYKYECNSKLKMIVKDIVSKIFLFWTSIDKINVIFDNVSMKYHGQNTGFVCSMSSHFSYAKQYMPYEIYGTPQLIPFGERMYYAPEKIEEYLTKIYGDYMKLPPESERQSNLEFFSEVCYDTRTDVRFQ